MATDPTAQAAKGTVDVPAELPAPVVIEPSEPPADGSWIDLPGATAWLPSGWVCRQTDIAEDRSATLGPADSTAVVELRSMATPVTAPGAVELFSLGVHSRLLLSDSFATLTRRPGAWAGWDHVDVIDGSLPEDRGSLRHVTLRSGDGPVVTVAARCLADSHKGTLPDLVLRSVQPERPQR